MTGQPVNYLPGSGGRKAASVRQGGGGGGGVVEGHHDRYIMFSKTFTAIFKAPCGVA